MRREIREMKDRYKKLQNDMKDKTVEVVEHREIVL
jgi:flagellar motility protein MotE (MotC chaperone)